MQQNHPNRTRSHIADNHMLRQKQSGDQHVLPEEESELGPHRPHRLNREDMQKIQWPGSSDHKEPASS